MPELKTLSRNLLNELEKSSFKKSFNSKFRKRYLIDLARKFRRF